MNSGPCENFTVEGSCLCGHIRYRAKLPHDFSTASSSFVNICHCTQCRKSTGAMLPSYFWLAEKHLVFLTPVENKAKFYQSSADTRRGFCPECGTQLFVLSDEDQGWRGITVGSLDDPDKIRMRQHIYWDNGVEQVKNMMKLDKTLPKYAVYKYIPYDGCKRVTDD
ncbi:uncharacterized protein VTP21DRAFT_11724 [Calcarisporiella thermophila]|uniref:uncharacterized protein n=1 Tax=Calcarisporiella thermophila TaxID=911321 RepID=UPI0037447117